MDADLLSTFAQFGAAGVIGWLWLSERRGAQERERVLQEAHRMLSEERVMLRTVVRALEQTSRALGALESGQRALVSAVRGPELRGGGVE